MKIYKQNSFKTPYILFNNKKAETGMVVPLRMSWNKITTPWRKIFPPIHTLQHALEISHLSGIFQTPLIQISSVSRQQRVTSWERAVAITFAASGPSFTTLPGFGATPPSPPLRFGLQNMNHVASLRCSVSAWMVYCVIWRMYGMSVTWQRAACIYGPIPACFLYRRLS